MSDRSAADRACKDPNPIIDGRKANVNLAYLGAKPRVMQPGEIIGHQAVPSLAALYMELNVVFTKPTEKHNYIKLIDTLHYIFYI